MKKLGLLSALVLGTLACGDDTAGSSMANGQGDPERSQMFASADGGVANGDSPDAGSQPAACGCDASACAQRGACLCQGAVQVCLCDPGHAGRRCGDCEPGFTAAGDRCLRNLQKVETEPPGGVCEAGGVVITEGLDADGNGALDADEVRDTRPVCNAPPVTSDPGNSDSSMTDAGSPMPVDCTGDGCCLSGSCDNGGACIDTDGNAPLCICPTGYTGIHCGDCASGYVHAAADGRCKLPDRLVLNEGAPRGPDCPSGGRRVLIGYDLNDDGELDAGEVESRMLDCSTTRVLVGQVTVSNQAQLNDLRSVTEIQGNLRINARYILDLTPLEQLSEVTGHVTVTGCDALTTLSGLQGLNHIGGDLALTGNAALAGVTSLGQLYRVGGSLVIDGNPVLTRLDGLERLTSVGASVTIQNNAELASLSGLSGLENVVGGLSIMANDKLPDLTGLAQLNAVGGALSVSGNPLLANVDVLSGLVDVGSLAVVGNEVLTDLDGLSGLRSVRGNLLIERNPSLTRLDGFGALQAIEGALAIRSNASLQQVGGFGALTRLTGGVSIIENGILTRVTGLTNVAYGGCGPLEYPLFPGPPCSPAFAITLAKNEELVEYAGMPKLDVGHADVRIANNPKLQTMGSLGRAAFHSRFDLSDNPALTQFGGMGVELVGGAFSVMGTGLSTIDFPGLREVTGAFGIRDNPALTALFGFDSFRVARGDFRISGNGKLVSLTGFGALTGIGGALWIAGTAVPTIDGFGNLQQLGAELIIIDNGALDGDAFPSLGRVGQSGSASVRLERNQALSTLAMLSGLQGAISLTVAGSPALVDLSHTPPCSYLTLEDVGATDLSSVPSTTRPISVELAGTSFTGLSGLPTSARTLVLRRTTALPASAPIPAHVTQLTLRDNDALTALPTLPALTGLALVNLGSLTSLSGWPGVPATSSLYTLQVADNAALTDLGTLPWVGINSLSVSGNNRLTTIATLFGTINVTELNILGNGSLMDLPTNKPLAIKRVTIQNNTRLPQCLALGWTNSMVSATTRSVTGNDTSATCP